jgi:hypothetical protein
MSKVNFGLNPEILKRAHSAREIGGKRPTIIQDGGVQKYKQTMPDYVKDNFSAIGRRADRDNYIKALHTAGWSVPAITKSAGMSQERVRQIIKSWVQTEHLPATLAIPLPPRREIAVKAPVTFTQPAPEMLARMRELQPLARLVRSYSPKYRAEADEYSYILNEAVKQGCTVYRLGKLLGVTPSAIAFRLVRYGYKVSANGETKCYQPVMEANRKKFSA